MPNQSDLYQEVQKLVQEIKIWQILFIKNSLQNYSMHLLYPSTQAHKSQHEKVCKKEFMSCKEWHRIEHSSVDTFILPSIIWNAVFPRASNQNETTRFLSSGPSIRLLFGSTLQNCSNSQILPHIPWRWESTRNSCTPQQQAKATVPVSGLSR